jgi:hypothetical protein
VDCDAKVLSGISRVSRLETILSESRSANSPSQKVGTDRAKDCDAKLGAESHVTTGPRSEKREARSEKQGARSEREA